MTYKWIRKLFLIAISFLTLGIFFSCKGQNKPNAQKDTFQVIFKVVPKEQGEITATVDGTPITSGTEVKRGKEVVFTLVPRADYTIEKWHGGGVDVDEEDTLMARLKVIQDVTVTAVLKSSKDPSLKLNSLKMYHKDVTITNPDDIKVEVENFVKTLSSSDVEATFTYGIHTTPEEIKVKVDKAILEDGDTLVKLSVPPVEGKYKYWNQMVKITRKEAGTPNDIPEECKVDAIEVALRTAKVVNNQYKLEDFVLLDNFRSDSSGPYTAADAKTAYVSVRVKAEKPSTGDYYVQLTNRTTYIAAQTLQRGTGKDASYFITGRAILSKGYNILDVKVKNPNGTIGTYTIMIKYDGGPDPLKLEMKKRKMLPGIYCPAQRKPLEGEAPDYVWMICMTGW